MLYNFASFRKPFGYYRSMSQFQFDGGFDIDAKVFTDPTEKFRTEQYFATGPSCLPPQANCHSCDSFGFDAYSVSFN